MSFPGMLTVLSIREQNNPLAYIPLVWNLPSEDEEEGEEEEELNWMDV
jgi:hypothetical protein